MTDTVVTALIAGGTTSLTSLLGLIGTISVQKKKSYEAHVAAQKEFADKIEKKLDAHRDEYMGRIDDVEEKMRLTLNEVSTMKAQTEKWQSNYEIKMDNLTEKVMKHNNFMERVAVLEKDVAVLNSHVKDI